MISEAELRRQAYRWQVDPMILDLDYALGWFLVSLAVTPDTSRHLRFKGGTCLRKCYFPDYRFSEDLDFTASDSFKPNSLTDWIDQAVHWSEEKGGPNFRAEPYRLDVVEDDYGKETYQVRIYYRGPLVWGGSPRAIRMDITRDELLLFPARDQTIFHPYSDAPGFGKLNVSCYSLEEILTEKLRALGGQRRFAISRDLYDIYFLSRANVKVAEVIRGLPEKFAARGLDMANFDANLLLDRRSEFEKDWQRRLNYLIPAQQAVTFTHTWQTALDMVRQVQSV